MPINANSFNSRITSEALEKKFRDVFPAQGGAELIQDLYAAGTIQPVIDFSSVAEGSFLAPDLQTAWDFSTGSAQVNAATSTLINTTGFWLVDLTFTGQLASGLVQPQATVNIFDGVTVKQIWGVSSANTGTAATTVTGEAKFVVFLRTGDSLTGFSRSAAMTLDIWYRQIADVNGNLVNPLGFTFS